MNRSSFLKIKIPLYPYLNFHRGPSTTYNESFHIKDSNRKIQYNVFWNCEETISISIFNSSLPERFRLQNDINYRKFKKEDLELYLMDLLK